ncbi:MAG: HNH endonuclease [Candidatus Sulfotelmatobacter sp.]
MPDALEVRLGSQASGVSGSFGKCGLVWSFPRNHSGEDSEENLITLCTACHSRVHQR